MNIYKILARLAVALAVAGLLIFLFLFALLSARGAFDCPPGTYQVNTTWVDAESGQERVDSICVESEK